MCSIIDLFQILAPLPRNVVKKLVNIDLQTILVCATTLKNQNHFSYIWEEGLFVSFSLCGGLFLLFSLWVPFSPCGGPSATFFLCGSLFCPFWACPLCENFCYRQWKNVVGGWGANICYEKCIFPCLL